MKKISVIYSNFKSNNETEFSVSKGWCKQFMRRNGLSLRRKSSLSQKDLEIVVSKFFIYVLRILKSMLATRCNTMPNICLISNTMPNIYTMNETVIRLDMVLSSTVDKTELKTVTSKSSRLEKGYVSLSLTSQRNG